MVAVVYMPRRRGDDGVMVTRSKSWALSLQRNGTLGLTFSIRWLLGSNSTEDMDAFFDRGPCGLWSRS
jgi:hypothetical protein